MSNLHSMELGESTSSKIEDGRETITRVPGGWIYTIEKFDSARAMKVISAMTSTFVPYSDEHNTIGVTQLRERIAAGLDVAMSRYDHTINNHKEK